MSELGTMVVLLIYPKIFVITFLLTKITYINRIFTMRDV